ncbi:16S rRNA (guanine(966)-N(2))-methyltransferase RsmD [Litoribacillus peritrichatus]|uniref:Ribosomal RNA small subunit methyltransferase D n=1 Tax=Litoribacillus peritrichatus TaxID=718191 RepID=A0ABP7MNE5_9GAMM
MAPRKPHNKAPKRNTKDTVKKPSELRIIGGEWRSRKVAFYPAEGLRPTLDRVRETAFNWLQPYIEGATCLDLFAGSGALTFEALSRHAKKVHINELNVQVRNTLADQLNLLKCDSARYQLTGFDGTQPQLSDRFDVIFLDPPFRKGLLEDCCSALNKLDIFKHHCVIYIESECTLESLALPDSWHVLKQKKAGQTHYGLIERVSGD